MSTVLLLSPGVFWTITYVLIIRQGLRDRTYGMPLVALCANISWEFIFSVVRPPTSVVAQTVYVVWFCFDVVIAYTAVRYGPREFPGLPRPVFYLGFAATLGLGYAGTDLFSREFDSGGPGLAAFASNLMMSGLFLSMLLGRRDLRGQSLWIAAAKFLGTLFASLYSWQFGKYAHSVVMPYLYIGNAVLDLAYVGALLAVRRALPAPQLTQHLAGDRQQVPG
jgi:hypothetical protein